MATRRTAGKPTSGKSASASTRRPAKVAKAVKAVKAVNRAGKRPPAATKRVPSRFDLATIPSSIRKSPVRLRDWLDQYMPWWIGPCIGAIEPVRGQRGPILTVRGAQFAPAHGDNEVTFNGTAVPVLAAGANELRVLVTSLVDSGTLQIKVLTMGYRCLPMARIPATPVTSTRLGTCG